MALKRRNKIDPAFFDAEEEGKKFVDVEIKYPFCYKTKGGKNYFRYLEDGRFEHICLEPKSHCLLFGTFTNSIVGLENENEYCFKVLYNRNTPISEEDFEHARSLLMVYYSQYLNGDRFVAWEVKELLRMKEINTKVNVKQVEEKINKLNDINTQGHGEGF